MAHTLVELARVLGWRSDLIEREEFSAADVDRAAVVVVATQGQGDEEAIEQALAGAPAYVGLVASRRRGEAVLGYLADRGVAQDALDRVRVPIGLDLGHTSHQEIAVAILAELVQLRATGALSTIAHDAPPVVPTAVDPVCGMTVPALESSWPVEHEGVTYHFCCAGCRSTFELDPATYATGGTRC
jgi:xanthine dehydrogenase accessory factor